MKDARIDAARSEVTPFDPGAEHELLAAMAGEWRGPTHTWFEPGRPPEESVTEVSISPLLGGRWLRIATASTILGKPHAGEMLLGFHKDANAFELAWVDSFHTGSAIMFCTGAAVDDGSFSVLGSYLAGSERWGWRTAFRQEGADLLVIEAYNVTPDGQEMKAMETQLSRR